MLHLLPTYQKKKVVTEYRLRLAVIFVLLIVVTIVMFAVFLMPSFMYLHTEKSDLLVKKENLTTLLKSKGDITVDKKGGDIVKTINALQPLSGTIKPILYVDQLAPSMSSVKVNSYFMSPTTDNKVGVVLGGTASTRESLTSYVGYLNDRFGGVKLPLSSLAKQTDIPFEFKFEVDQAKLMGDESPDANASASSTSFTPPTSSELSESSDPSATTIQ